jgi:hypothetical protein
MTDCEVSGKRFSRVVKQTLETADEIRAALATYKPFAHLIAEDVERARAFLRGLGLPDAPMVVRLRATDDWACYVDQPFEDVIGAMDLDEYLIRHRGIERDAPAHIAARAVVLTAEMKHPDRDRAIKAAYELGRLHSLSLVYHADIVGAKKRGRKSKRRLWADVLADFLVDKGALTNAEARAMIPDSYSPLQIDEDHEIFLDDDKKRGKIIVFIDPITEQRVDDMTLRNFIDRYFRRKLKDRAQQRR